MARLARMRQIVVALDDVDMPRGRLELAGAEGRPFDGWLELIAALEESLRGFREDDTPVLEART
jgi:hypothetical protein